MTPIRTPTLPRPRRDPSWPRLFAVLAVVLSLAVLGVTAATRLSDRPRDLSGVPAPTPPDGLHLTWPVNGQAAVQIDDGAVLSTDGQRAVAIASVAKVMTALVVLRDHPLAPGQDGPSITITDDDEADTERRRQRDESLIDIAPGEQLSERQALQAVLLPSANNVAIVLARWDAGSVDNFTARMNDTARQLGMSRTLYTDPSGFEPDTVSTATDQLRLAQKAMQNRTFAQIVNQTSAELPVAGTIRNTNTLIGKEGFVGVKTGSDDAAGGCLAFRAYRQRDGRRVAVTGVVLGQQGHDLIGAASLAALALARQVSPTAAAT